MAMYYDDHKSPLEIIWSPVDNKFLVSLRSHPNDMEDKVNIVSFQEGNSSFFIACQLHKLIEPWTKTDEHIDKLRNEQEVLQFKYDDLAKSYSELHNDHLELLGIKKAGKVKEIAA